jgi:undecaprenyl-diphosphatase
VKTIDYSLYEAINGLTGNAAADHLVRLLASDLAGLLVVLVALTFLVPWRTRRQERRSGAVLATASAGLSLLLNQPIAHLVDRARPYLSHPGHAHLLIARSQDPSFPSDHATGAFALAFAIWLYDRTFGTILLAIAAILSFARIYVGTHYPGDVVGGALIGIAVVASLYLLAPARRPIESVALGCGAIWDRLTNHLITTSSRRTTA